MTDTNAIEAATEVALRGLRQGDGAKVRQGVSFLEVVLTTFVEELKDYGVVFDERWLREDLIGWRALNDITRQIGKFVREAVSSESIEFIREAQSLAYKLARYGIDGPEYVTFQTAMQLLGSLYSLTGSAANSDVREYGRVHSERSIAEIVRFYLVPALRKARGAQLELYGALAKVCFVQYQQLLAQAIEQRDAKSFSSVLAGLGELLRPLPSRDQWTEHLIVLRGEGEVFGVNETRELVRLGAGVRLLLDKSQDEQLVPYFAEVLNALAPLPQLTELVLKALRSDVSSQLDWIFWEMPERGGIAWSHDAQALTHLYTVAALRTEPPPSLPHARHSDDLVSATEWLRMSLNASPPPPWVAALSRVPQVSRAQEEPGAPDLEAPNLALRASRLEDVHRDAVEAQKAVEQDELITAPLSDARVQHLLDEIDSDLRKNDGLSRLFASVGRLERVSDCADDQLRQLPSWTSRGAFTDLPGWGELGASELAAMLIEEREEALLKTLDVLSPQTCDRPTELWRDVASALRNLTGNSGEECLVVLSGGWRLYSYPDDRFQEHWQLGDEHPLKSSLHFQGEFEGKPVFQAYGREGFDVWITVVGRHGRLETCDFDGRDFRLEVEQFDRAAAESLLSRSPAMTKGGEPLDHESAVREIRERVVLRTIFGFNYSVEDETAAIVLRYSVQPDVDD